MDDEADKLVVSQDNNVGSGSVLTFDDLAAGVTSNQLWHTKFLQTHRTTLRPINGCSAQAASEALNALYKATALEGCEPAVAFTIDNETDMRKGALEAMTVAGYVHKTVDTGVASSWQVTEAGQQLVVTSYELAWGPRAPLLRNGVPVEEMTELELVIVLANRGWEHKFWMHYLKDRDPDSGSQPPPVCVPSRSPKVWWAHENTQQLDKNYLIALVKIDQVLHPKIFHLKGSPYYKTLFKAETALALEDDDAELRMLQHKPKRKQKPKHALSEKGAEAGERQARQRPGSDNNYSWGPGLMTYKPPNTWQATCGRCQGSHRNLARSLTQC